MNTPVEFKVNGKKYLATTDGQRTLLEVLREDLQLTGTKYGCGEGQCRACTVLLDGQPVRSCQTTMDEMDGHTVETIESVAPPGALHPVQEAFVQEQAMQCGYCVPGMIMSTIGLLRRNPSPTRTEIVAGLNGNLCRCCGYVNIVNAVERAARSMKEAK